MIVRDRNINYIDANGQECFDKDHSFFPLLATQEDVNNYAGKQIDIHYHEQFELFILDKGQAIFSVDCVEHLMHENEACFVGPNCLHKVETVAGQLCQYRSFVIHPSILIGSLESVFTMKINKMLYGLNHFIKIENTNENKIFFDEFDLIFKAMDEEYEDYEFQIRNSLSNIFMFLKKIDKSDIDVETANVDILKNMINWIEENLQETIRVEDISLAANLSIREVQRIFKRSLGISPMEYVRKKRILKSAEELSNPNTAIIDLVYKYKFCSPSHFTITFKKFIGVNPNDFRKNRLHSN